jgi:hypothetical protein
MRWAITHRINVPPPIDDEDDRPDDYEYARIHHFGGPSQTLWKPVLETVTLEPKRGREFLPRNHPVAQEPV